MDFKAKPNKNFEFDCNWASKDIDVRSVIEDNYFVVQIVISIQSLKNLSLLKEDEIETGIFRAKYNKEKDNSFQPTWISWVKPDSETPNFHIPSSFGVLVLEDYK